MRYPILDINTNIIRSNAIIVRKLCLLHGIEPVAVIKGFNGLDEINRVIVEAGFTALASSRLAHLKQVKERGYPVKTLALRIPMLSELAELVEYADISLGSEIDTFARLNDEARRQHKVHRVILMRDLGDLREGIIDSQQFIDIACEIEGRFSNLYLYGVGTNLGCYGSIIPSTKNMSQLVDDALTLEKAIGRTLDVISGGGGNSIPLLLDAGLPDRINNLRIGSALLLRSEIPGLPQDALLELSDETLILRAEIIEIGNKPTYPIGDMGTNCFGSRPRFKNKGVRRRALLAVGAFDYCDCKKLIPCDKNVKVLGCSSDHTIIDIQDSNCDYQLGDSIAFHLLYQSMLFATANPHIHKRVVF